MTWRRGSLGKPLKAQNAEALNMGSGHQFADWRLMGAEPVFRSTIRPGSKDSQNPFWRRPFPSGPHQVVPQLGITQRPSRPTGRWH